MGVECDDTATSAHHVMENPSNLIGPQSQSPRKLSRHTGTSSIWPALPNYLVGTWQDSDGLCVGI